MFAMVLGWFIYPNLHIITDVYIVITTARRTASGNDLDREVVKMTTAEMWDTLQDVYGVSEQTLQVVTDLNGYSEETMCDVLYSVAGLRSFEQDDE